MAIVATFALKGFMLFEAKGNTVHLRKQNKKYFRLGKHAKNIQHMDTFPYINGRFFHTRKAQFDTALLPIGGTRITGCAI